MLALSLVLGGLGLKLFVVQVVNGPEKAKEALALRSHRAFLPEWTRGHILDTNGVLLTGQGQGWICCAYLPAISDYRRFSLRASRYLKREPWVVEAMLRRAKKQSQKLVILGFIKPGQSFKKGELNSEPGMMVLEVPRRYRQDGYLKHILGEIRTVNTKSGVETQGVSGLEKRYDQYLRLKEPVYRLVMLVDGKGKLIPGLSPKVSAAASARGKYVVTTIDAEIQSAVEKVMDEQVKAGAVVVLDVSTRDILAAASRPVQAMDDTGAKDWESSYALNRAFSPFYPGSLFKIVVAAAALELKVVEPHEQFFCSGSYAVSPQLSIPCWKKDGHGSLNIGQALASSCNAAFIEIGLKLGRKNLLEFCRRLHLVEPDIIGFDNGQAKGVVNIDYGQAALANACLGQKGVKLTPLQAANLVATLADRGRYKRPRLVKEIRLGSEIVEEFPGDPGEQVLNEEVCDELLSYLRLVTQRGTGIRANFPGAICGGKTATAQTGQLTEEGEELLDTWFVGYFPFEKPRWVIAVLVEHGESGGRNAAPVFREIAREIWGMQQRGM